MRISLFRIADGRLQQSSTLPLPSLVKIVQRQQANVTNCLGMGQQAQPCMMITAKKLRQSRQGLYRLPTGLNCITRTSTDKQQHDYENFLCTLLLPSHSRTSAFAVRAFNIEVAKVQDQVSDPRLGRMRMKFWEETVEKIYVDDTPSHPVAVELYRAIRRNKLSKRYLKRLITVRADWLTSAVFPDLEAVESYAEHSVSSVYYLLLEVSGVESIHADHAASHLGKAHGIVNLIRSVPYNAQRKIVSLPQDVLLQHNVPHETVLRGSCTTDLKEAVFDIAARAKQHLDKARSLSDTIPRSVYPLLLPAVAIDSYLEKLRLNGFDVFSTTLQKRNSSLPFLLFWNKLFSRY